MTCDEISARLEPWLIKQRRPSWKPVVNDSDGTHADSKFGGTPWTSEDAPWPTCGRCLEPLTLFLQLDLDTLPDELGQRFGTGLLQLFYCTRDDCQGYGGWMPFEDSLSRVRIIQPESERAVTVVPPQVASFPAMRIVGWTRFIDLPDPFEHPELGLTYTYTSGTETVRIECPELGFDLTNPVDDCEEEDIATSQTCDKLAGWPAWIQDVDYPTCPQCDRRMIHVFQLDSQDNIPFMFGDMGTGHITQCEDHKNIVAFSWSCF